MTNDSSGHTITLNCPNCGWLVWWTLDKKLACSNCGLEYTLEEFKKLKHHISSTTKTEEKEK